MRKEVSLIGTKGNAFYEAGSWYHRLKVLRQDGTTRYTKKGGFASKEEAEKSYKKYEKEYKETYRAYHTSVSGDVALKEYLIYWLDNIYSTRVEASSMMLASYVVYDLLIPQMEKDIKLRHLNVDYLDDLLARTAKVTESAGNKSRELLNIALRDALVGGYIKENPMPFTKPYKRKKPKVLILKKEQLKIFLKAASENNWYLEILLGLFLGLRKGELLGLKFKDIDMENRTLKVQRQVTAAPVVEKGGSKIIAYKVAEKEPKTPNSYRVLRVPKRVMEEICKRKEKMGEAYSEDGYISCTENGLPHSPSSFNTAITKLCNRNALPHITPHGLRHMYATILMEQGVALPKISALLGHSSVHTTFEYYSDCMDEKENIIDFLNNAFLPEE